MSSEVELAEELMRKARYPEAIERFRALLSVDPENAGVRARCGEAYRLSGNNERAFHHYNKAAAIYLRNSDASSALRMLQFANSVSPNEPEVLFRIAECLKALGEHQNMEPVLLQLVQVAKGTGDRRRLWALDELAARYPDDMDICARRAEALAEAGRIDDAVTAWKKVSAWLDQRGVDFVPMLQRAASIAPERPDVGVDLANILLANRRAREALILLVPYYEKFPDDVGVLAALLTALEELGATDKIIPARIELIKARAKRGMREGTMREISVLMQTAPEDIAALEVCAHACTAFNETAQAITVWRKLAHLCDRLQKKFERDRAILMLLKANPDDEDALTLGARALREATRNEEAQVLENRLAMIRRMRTRSPGTAQKTPPSKSATVPAPARARVPTQAERRVSQFSLDDSAITPNEIPVNMFHPSEPSEPSLESMPIARNPYVDDLYLEAGPTAANVLSAPSISGPPISAPPILAPSISTQMRSPRSISAPSVLREQRESELQNLDDPTRPYPTHNTPADIFASDDDNNSIDVRRDAFSEISGSGSGDSSASLPFDDSLHTLDNDPDADPGTAYGELAALEEDGAEMPIESPSGEEETTSRFAQLVSDELAELRGQLQDDTVRSRALQNMPVAREDKVSPPPDFDVESVRPTQRLQKLSDLFADLDRKKA